MARRYGRRRRGHQKFKIPIISIGILVGQGALAGFGAGKLTDALSNLVSFYTGFDPMHNADHFMPERLVVGWGPWLAKGLIMKVARPMGMIPKIPYGIPVSIS